MKKPPEIFKKILSWFLKDHDNEEILGDFEEKFNDVYNSKNIVLSTIWYLVQISISIPRYIKIHITWSVIMFKNYMKIAFRNMNRSKIYTVINLFSLSVGFACTILITQYIQYEMSYDHYNINADRIYRVVTYHDEAFYLGFSKNPGTPPPLIPALKNEFPEIEEGARISGYYSGLINIKREKFKEDKWVWADTHIFNVFTMPFVYGDPETALNKPRTVVIDEETAQKYFGNENPVGKTLEFIYFSSVTDYEITGVMRKIPQNSHFKPRFIASANEWGESAMSWRSTWFRSYILLKKGFDHRELEKKIQSIVEKNIDPLSNTSKRNYLLQPLTDIYLRSTDFFASMKESTGDIKNVYIWSLIAFFILLIACINYINLATARSIKRAKEVGIRKVVGGQRVQLIKQFFSESFITVFISLSIAVVLVYLVSDRFAAFIGMDTELSFIKKKEYFFILLGGGFLVSTLSGAYPALYLSGFKPAVVFNKGISVKSKSISLRHLLVVFQFAISIFFILSTCVISGQMNFIRNRKSGYDRKNVVVINIKHGTFYRNLVDNIKNELLQNPRIEGVTFSLTLPIQINFSSRIDYQGRGNNELLDAHWCEVDYDYIDFFNMEIIRGRNFSREVSSDRTGQGVYILNETAVRQLGWQNPVGKKIKRGYDPEMGIIVGIVKDFTGLSLHHEQQPVVLKLTPDGYTQPSRFMSIKINKHNVSENIEFIEKIWKKYSGGYPSDYFFMDEAYLNMYKSEIRLHTMFKCFTVLAVFISCLGLFGLVSYTALQSKKEIGIRKVFGASIKDIFMMISWKFIRLIIIAIIIALPTGYFIMEKWLQNFAFKVNIGLFYLLSAGFLSICIALITISFHSIKSATANPVDSLRNE